MQNSPAHSYFATAPKGVTSLLADELRALGAADIREVTAGVLFSGKLEVGYRACLWSRTANRVLMLLSRFAAPDADALHAGVQTINWDDHLAAEGTLAVDVNVRGSRLSHSQFAARRVKDAIVDQLRDRHGVRPSVDLERPDLRINVFIDRDVASVAIDLSGESLHRRGYRDETVVAPLKQNLAAAILLRAGWSEIARGGGGFVDPMCGSGTLLVEAAWIAGDRAPALLRREFGFDRWRGHVPRIWQRLREEAQARAADGERRIPPMRGYDADLRAVRAARENVAAAGLASHVRIDRSDVADVPPPETAGGLLVVNPPYGERLGDSDELRTLYARLGEMLRARYQGWEAAVFTGNPPLGRFIGLKARRVHTFYNGAIECRLLRFTVAPEHFEVSPDERARAAGARPLGEGAQMFANRLRKNMQALQRWAEQEGVTCYRIYDADMPEYAAAIDLYLSERPYLVVQEYAAPKTVAEDRARQRLRDILNAIPPTLGVGREQVFLKRRERQRGTSQYERQAQTGEFHEVREGPCRLLVNFSDYLDTGLFLDHRLTRAMVGELARGRDMLNLFCYTATASAHAALAGARSTVSVDMSATYLDWARRNFALNGIDPRVHVLVQADCLRWLEQQAGDPRAPRYGVIFLDPPTFSNSKRMQSIFDVQRDHATLVRRAASLLTGDGVLVFSTNRQRFRLDVDGLAGLRIEDVSERTIPRDFARNAKIHRCWLISAPAGSPEPRPGRRARR